ncbi:hypothetical protein NAA24_03925 [Listeria monocytogenes]|nr:hypothetical protein [Listeria monocytogenes]
MEEKIITTNLSELKKLLEVSAKQVEQLSETVNKINDFELVLNCNDLSTARTTISSD